MNPIIDYFQREVQSNTNPDAYRVLESVIKYAEPEHILEAAQIVCTYESGAKLLEEIYTSTPLSEMEVAMNIVYLNNWKTACETSKNLNYALPGKTEALDRCLEKLNSIVAIRNTDEYAYGTTMEKLTSELHQMENRIVLEGTGLDLTEEQVLETTVALTQAQFNIEFTKAFMNPHVTDESVLESVNQMMRLSNRYDGILAQSIILEGDKNGNGKIDSHEVVVKKDGKEIVTDKPSSSAGQSAHATATKASHAVRSKASKTKRSTAGFKKAGGEAKDLVGGAIEKLDDMNKEERMEAIMQGGIRKKASTLIRTAILTGAATAINPALGIITLLSSAAMRRRSDVRLKEQVVSEYEGELKLVREKLRDAEQAGDRKKKYQLMRIENHLERNIERVKSPMNTNRSKVRRG